MSEYLLEMKNITKSFSGVHALDDVNFAVRPGKVMCLAGENGSGKSPLVKIVSGVYAKDEVKFWFQGEKITKITPAEATKLGIQVIYQDLSIFPNLTVRENLAMNSEITANRQFVSKSGWTRPQGRRSEKSVTKSISTQRWAT
jgi:simple sugar transport system ATP-binding protein